MKDKDLIGRNFNKVAFKYDAYAHIQKKAANHCVKFFIDHCKDFLPHTILDVGAGTGFVAEQLLQKFPKASYTLNDLSLQMLQQAKKKLKDSSKVIYHLADAEREFFPNAPYDLIISNFTFQWFFSLEKGLKNLWKQARCMAFSTLIQGTFQEWEKAYSHLQIPCKLRKFPTPHRVQKICFHLSPARVFFEVYSEKLYFEKAIDFVRYLKKIGAHTSEQQTTTLSLPQILNHFPKDFHTHYQILYGVLVKE